MVNEANTTKDTNLTSAKVYNAPPRIEICRNCHGTGRVDLSSLYNGVNGKCPVCNGMGRVVKAVTVSIDLKPYEQES